MTPPLSVQALRLPLQAEVQVPGSKSHANRALVCAALTEGITEIRGATACDDVEMMVENLQKLGFRVEWTDKVCGVITVHGGIPKTEGKAVLDCHNAGTTIRFLTSIAALVPGVWTLTGDKHMQKRPLKDLLDALRQLGVEVESQNGCPPVQIRGGCMTKSEVTLKADISSQYLTSLLLAAPCMKEGLTITLTGELTSKGYVDLTAKVMEDFGVKLGSKLNTFIVQQGHYRTKNVYNVEGDWSAAGAWLVLEALTDSTINIPNLRQDSLQSDKALPSYIARLKKNGNITMDASSVPDQVMNLAVLASYRKGTTQITGVKNLRVKECDRLHVLTTQLQKAGVQITEQDDGVTIIGGELPADGVTLDPHDDHRMAMCFAILGLVRGGVNIKNPECVKKSYPDFFSDLEAISQSHKPVTIVGMRGVGKSIFGKRLATKLKSKHMDSDHLFEDRYGPIKLFISKQGWDGFRKAEEEIIAESLRPGIVLSLGGGSLTSPKTRKLVKSASVPVWLQAREAELIKRLKNGKRPPLTNLPLHEEVRKYLLERGPHYREVAQVEISPTIAFGQQVPFAMKALAKLFRSKLP